MKILLIHQYFRTPDQGGALRSYYLASEMVRSGFSVDVITSTNNPSYSFSTIDGIQVHYIPVAYRNEFRFTRRIAAFLKFAYAANRFAKKFTDADLCYAISVPLTIGWTALRLKRKYNIPFVFEVGDLWPDAPIELGVIRNKKLIDVLYKFERRVYMNATSVVALSQPIADVIKEKSPTSDIAVVPNFSDVDFFKPIPAKKKSSFVISYVGAIGYANGLEYLLSCAAFAQKNELDIQFNICGQGAMLKSLKMNAHQANLQNVKFIPFQNRDGVKAILEGSDAVFVSFLPFSILETGSPNKYFDGLAAGKMIIINFGGWVKEEIELRQCGIALDPRKPEELVEKIRDFLSNEEKLRRFQENARALAIEKYSRSVLGKKISDHLKILIQNNL